MSCVVVASGDVEDEEGTIEEQEGMEGGLDHRAELEELQQEGVSECAVRGGEGRGMWMCNVWLSASSAADVVCCVVLAAAAPPLVTAGDLSLEELMAKYGYVSQEVEDSSDSSDGDSECSPCILRS